MEGFLDFLDSPDSWLVSLHTCKAALTQLSLSHITSLLSQTLLLAPSTLGILVISWTHLESQDNFYVGAVDWQSISRCCLAQKLGC